MTEFDKVKVMAMLLAIKDQANYIFNSIGSDENTDEEFECMFRTLSLFVVQANTIVIQQKQEEQ